MADVQSLSAPQDSGVEQLAAASAASTHCLELTERDLYHLLRLVLIEMKSEKIAATYNHRLHLLAERMRLLADGSEGVEDLWEELVGEELMATGA